LGFCLEDTGGFLTAGVQGNISVSRHKLGRIVGLLSGVTNRPRFVEIRFSSK
jgi:hypothetical protein